jgi:hypothetical protein
MTKTTNITVIIPVHSTDCENFDNLFSNALTSISNNDVHPEKVIIVAPPQLKSKLQGLMLKDMVKTEILENNGKTDFATQINIGVDKVETDYFSFLEFDDEYSDLWFRNAEKYIAEYPEVAIFLPIISDANTENKFLGYTNEIAWAYEFTDKQGYVDKDVLKDYPNFNPDGMVMKVSEFKRIGGYKKNIKLAFNLEFLLRACDHGLQILVVPKIGYKHVNMRPASLFWEYKNGEQGIDSAESEFWMETAQKEFYYTDDRPVTYIPKLPEPINSQDSE